MRSREWVACRPGTEAAVALGLAGKADAAWVEKTSGVPARRLKELAKHRALGLVWRGRSEDQRAVATYNAGWIGKEGGIVAQPRVSLTTVAAESVPEAVESGKVETVVLAGVNPAFDSPSPGRWRRALAKARHVVALSMWDDETTRLAGIVLPLSRSAELAAALGGGKVEAEAPGAIEIRMPEAAWKPPAQTEGEFHLLMETPLALARGHGWQHPYLITNVGAHLREWWTTWVEVNPKAAAKKGIRDRDLVRLRGAGEIVARAKLFEGIPPDAVCVPLGMGHAFGTFGQKEGGNPAELVENWEPRKVRLEKS
jgi:anaerobic selenocysteine-containing dehydrogenase